MKFFAVVIGMILSASAIAQPGPGLLTKDDLPLPVEVTEAPPVEVSSVPGELLDSIEALNRPKTPILLYAQVNQDGPIVTAGDIREWPSGDVFSVPLGQQLVIEHVSIAPVGTLQGNENLAGILLVGPIRFFVGRLTAEQQQYVFWPGSGETVNIRVGPGETPRIGGPSNVNLLVNYSLSGYLEPVE